MSRRMLLACAVCVLAAAIGGGVALASALRASGAGHAVRAAPPAPAPARNVTGWPFDRPVPAMRLIDSRGRATSLTALRGRVVVLAPSMTLCHEVCPMTTGALEMVQRTLAADGLSDRTAVVEVTVDPWRDSPARLRAYARLTGARFALLTGTAEEVRRFWTFFGIGFKRVKQGNPPDIDWWTHRPESFDVEHADGVFLIDARGRERTYFPGPAGMRGHLSQQLRSLLSADGRRNLAHPLGAWTPSQVLAGVRRLLGRSG
ncbi:MAG TPA: SCO family protein [Solirubrobacteraceae bacterium]|nr:SCO family protein [Solirubrobacteraceae bacterium]